MKETLERSAAAPVTLARGAVGLPTVLMQSVAQIAPALGILGTFGFNTSIAGLGAPSTYLLAFVVALIVAATLAQLARFLPSAGGFYTYVSVTVGPSWGFLVGWMYSWFVAAIPGAVAAFVAFVLSDQLARNYGIDVPWPVFVLAIVALIATVAYRGIRVSGTTLMALSLIEMLILLTLSAWGLAFPGPGGLSFAGFHPGSSTNANGFFLAVVFSI